MIPFQPHPYADFTCPECGSRDILLQDFVFQGIHVLASLQCNNCKLNYWEGLPTGHTLTFPVRFAKDKQRTYPDAGLINDWLAGPVAGGYYTKDEITVPIRKKVLAPVGAETVIINCLDFWYGHILAKLLNVQHHLEKDNKSIIVIIPASFEWLLPEGISEAWILDIPLSKTRKWVSNLDAFVKEELKRLDKVYLGMAYSHPDYTLTDISLFSKVPKFDLAKFSDTDPVITFIWRQDRVWQRNTLEKLFQRWFKKAGLSNKWAARLQKRRFEQTARLIKARIPQARFNLVGLGTAVEAGPLFNDFRVERPDFDMERKWCEVYSQSHIIIGVHGSNMLLPTAHAAGFVELLPEDRIGNITQDIASPYANRFLLFLGRFVPENSGPAYVAQHAVSMIRTFDFFYKTTHPDYNVIRVLDNVDQWKLK